MGEHMRIYTKWKNFKWGYGFSCMLLGCKSSQMRSFFRTSVNFMKIRASISKVLGDDRLGISSSYDATIMLWDLKKKDMCQKLLGPHK